MARMKQPTSSPRGLHFAGAATWFLVSVLSTACQSKEACLVTSSNGASTICVESTDETYKCPDDSRRDACPTRHLVGICEGVLIAVMIEHPFRWNIYFYDYQGFTKDNGKADCIHLGGKWSPEEPLE